MAEHEIKIYKLNELQQMMIEDSKMDKTKLDSESVSAPYLYSRYIVIHSDEKAMLKAYQVRMKRMIREKTAYYRGDADPEVYKKNPLHISILKSAVPQYVKVDKDVEELQNKIDIQEIKIEMLNEYMKTLYQRTFYIKSAIDYQKFINGA